MPAGAAGRGFLAFIGRHATGLVLQVDIAALSLAIQGRGFPPDIEHFLIETIGAYAIGASVGAIGKSVQSEMIRSRQAEFDQLYGDISRRAQEAARTGHFDEAAFNRTKQELLEYWSRVEAANTYLRDAGIMSSQEHAEGQSYITDRKTTISGAKWRGGTTTQRTSRGW